MTELAATPPPRPAITDIAIGHVNVVPLFAFIISFTIPALLLTIALSWTVASIVIAWIVAAVVFVVVRRLANNRRLEGLESKMAIRSDRPIAGIRDYYAPRDRLSILIKRESRTIVEQLSAAGEFGHIIRLCPEEHHGPITALTVPFEAQPLNETDPNFADIAGYDELAGEDDTWRRVKRNVTIKGGWWIAGIFAFNVVIEALKAFRQGEITNGLLWWSALLLFTLFGAGKGFASLTNWYAVPGGILVTAGSWIGRKRPLRRFVRNDANLLIYKFNKRLWVACAGNAIDQLHLTLTTREVHFLLRAWLSPLDPPELEEVKGLV